MGMKDIDASPNPRTDSQYPSQSILHMECIHRKQRGWGRVSGTALHGDILVMPLPMGPIESRSKRIKYSDLNPLVIVQIHRPSEYPVRDEQRGLGSVMK